MEWLKFNFASCVVHQTRTYNMFFVNLMYDMIISPQFYQISFARVLCFIFMKDIGRLLPWMLPGSTGRFLKKLTKQDDFP